ncbi:hypothetical protein D623_10011630 [Myotis brandtii]|uniref:Uncharacterized protein n=1 Tax=Myotis brandtii TaxID=109478 RepID=S7NHI4_MYOBR|nr:hypothetical protein D623_10011630 [Myotis brandtii]
MERAEGRGARDIDVRHRLAAPLDIGEVHVASHVTRGFLIPGELRGFSPTLASLPLAVKPTFTVAGSDIHAPSFQSISPTPTSHQSPRLPIIPPDFPSGLPDFPSGLPTSYQTLLTSHQVPDFPSVPPTSHQSPPTSHQSPHFHSERLNESFPHLPV